MLHRRLGGLRQQPPQVFKAAQELLAECTVNIARATVDKFPWKTQEFH
eukprot:CAMPEP_0171083676 /NCGR_PEP_ID=MMETSP0766_2-20121228/17862_1 /TAXON_ID=439317 /ORGANISM="Gambierdiscus australes, Strain CAWD 149" /LENGTH=47 /DNA_ID= /DNA_START= /DNA_END= /DNA_ORIENTATION=